MLSIIRKIDLGLALPVLFLSAVGLIGISSAAPKLFPLQAMWLGLGLALAALVIFFDPRPLVNHRLFVLGIYFFAVALIVATLIFAPTIRGQKSWLTLGPIQFQTSEFAKVALITILSYFFAKRHIGIAHLKNILIPALYMFLPASLIMAEPDMGTALILLGIFVGYLFVSGIKPRHVFIGLIIFAAMFAWAWNNFLADYQKERVMGLFNPEQDPLGRNYNVIQSKIAIGSGGFWGKGFRQGTQAQLGFLPEAASDFILPAIVEEWGFFGGLLIILAFSALLLRLAYLGLVSGNNFFKLFSLGTMAAILLHFIFNVGSAAGLFPVIGVPLPFVSYGGSNLIINFVLLGVIQSLTIKSSY